MTRDTKCIDEFESALPLDSVVSGNNLLVSGPSESGACEAALRLVLAADDREEGMLIVSADVDSRSLLERCQSLRSSLSLSRVGVVDCAVGDVDWQQRFAAVDEPIDGPGDLAAINTQLSVLYETLSERELDGIRIGVFSVTSLLLEAPFQEVSRFLHMLTGRVIATDDLGVYLVDPAAVDDGAVESLEAYCDGHVQVRPGDESRYQCRIDGLDEVTEE